MRPAFRSLAALAAALMLVAQAPAVAQTPSAGPPPGFVAPAEPKPEENNAQRGQTQPGNNAPFWRSVRESASESGTTSLKGAEQGTLIQGFVKYPGSSYTTAGEAWRQVRNQWIIPYGGALLLLVTVAIGIFYWRKGALGGHIPDTGRTVERFTPFERAAHGLNALTFVLLAVSGIVMAFGKFFLLPVLGATLFGWLSFALKNIHNFAGPLFAVTLVVVIVTFVRDNLPREGDMRWLKSFGGMTSDHEVPSHRFNAGEKLLFWAGVFGLGLITVLSGLFVDQLVPGFAYTRSEMQIGLMIHGVSTALMMALFLGHIYMGTIGTKGALDGMRTGQVDEAWAQEHHELWYKDIKAGKIPAQRSSSSPVASGDPKPQT